MEEQAVGEVKHTHDRYDSARTAGDAGIRDVISKLNVRYCRILKLAGMVASM